MTHVEYNTPLRIRWNLDTGSYLVGSEIPLDTLKKVSVAIIQSKALSLSLTSALNQERLPEILKDIKKAGVRITVGFKGIPFEMDTLRSCYQYIDELVYEVGIDTSHNISQIKKNYADFMEKMSAFDHKIEWSLSVTPHTRSLENIPALILIANSLGVEKIVLPTLSKSDLLNGYERINNNDAEILKILMSVIHISAMDMEFDIYDFELWEMFNQSRPFGYCDAANGVCYVDYKGMVYPCDLILEPLDSLLDTNFSEIYSGARRKKLRRDIVEYGRGDCFAKVRKK